jgi:hypothetical protein
MGVRGGRPLQDAYPARVRGGPLLKAYEIAESLVQSPPRRIATIVSETPEAGAQRCPECGGSLLPGVVAMPIIGGLRFVYRAGTNEVATEVDAGLCANCGRVTLTARDPARIVQAQRAFRLGRASPRWRLPPRSAPSDTVTDRGEQAET